MRAYLISKLIQVLMKQLAKHAPALLIKFADYVLDWVEEYVLGTASTLDDRVILPLCKMIRDTYNIPDDDELNKNDMDKVESNADPEVTTQRANK